MNLSARKASAVHQSLLKFDNHDSRIPYYELMMEGGLNHLPEMALPSGYRFATYRPGDRDDWISIEKSAREFESHDEGLAVWKHYFAPYDSILPGRMYFVVNRNGEKVGTASAFFDIHSGDDGANGWLHWVAVRREEQGHGLSKPLILHVLHRMKELGYCRAVIPTQTTTWLACKIYLDLGFRPIPQNAEKNRQGWQIVRTLTDHPALTEFEPVAIHHIVCEQEFGE